MKTSIRLFCAVSICTMFLSGCKKDDAVAVERITLDQTDVPLTLGQTVLLKATVVPDNAGDKTLEWRSDNDAIASVNDGTVMAVSEGTAKITVSAKANPAVKAEATVTVSRTTVPLQSISLNNVNITLAPAMTFRVEVILVPATTTQTLFNYSTDNPAVAQIAGDGTITAVNDGPATITVTSAANPAITATASVMVISDGEVALSPIADNERLPLVAYLINDPYSVYGDIGYSKRKASGGTTKTWTDGGEPGKDMIDAGVTHVIFQTFNHTEVGGQQTADVTVRTPKIQATLDICQEYGLKAIVPFADCWDRDWDDFLSGALDLSSLFSAIAPHPAVAGWHGIDEPAHDAAEFTRMKNINTKVASYDTRPVHHNLLPNYAAGLTTEAAYRAYVRDYLNEVQPPYLSFDNYPLSGPAPSVDVGFYENLKIISEEAKADDIPFWGFANSSAFGNQADPTRQNLRFQVFTNLAYGAQCIEFFAWWTGDATYDRALFGEATTGDRTPFYDEAKVVGLEIKNLSRVFKGAAMTEIWYAKGGGLQPRGTVAFNPANHLPSVFKSFTINGKALISLMEKDDSNYLVIVNGSPSNTLELDVETERGVREVTKNNTAIYASGPQHQEIEGGDILIYEWPKAMNN